ncbi:MAG: glycosyltransferase [Ignavibacteriales bacterium]|nr:glycosyltransferase [Ignavibacteriales bacterium]
MPSKRAHIAVQLSVIIVNYNVREFLSHALVSLTKALKGIAGEIIVVDNASDDGSVEMMRRDFPKVRLIANKSNLGFAKANNLALKKARGQCILLINPDTIVQENTLRVMAKFFEENPDVGLAGCKILNPDGSFQLACRRSFPTTWVAFTKISGLSVLFPKSPLFGRYNLTYLSPDETYEVDAVSGSFMMVRREAFKRVGGLDEGFFMYGEDLDWCYRFQRAGWKNYYVHSTQIIHYKGESTRRSSIDEIRMFYDAMRLFVRKHLRRPWPVTLILRLGITLSSWMAMIRQSLRPFAAAAIDVVLIVASLMVAEIVRLGELFHYPAYAYPAVYTLPSVLIVAGLYGAGVYTHRRMSVSRTALVVFVSYVIISAMVAFFKDYAFSRLVIVLSGAFNMILLPGWRLVLRLRGRATAEGRKSLFGRRTLIVGVDESARKLLKRLRQRIGDGYEVLGFIDYGRRNVGRNVDGVPIVGSLDNVGKVIHEQRVNDVIFSTEKLSYADILSVIGRTSNRSVNYHLVPNTLEVIIGKASVDSLNDLPLVQISYNIEKPLNRLLKRAFDITTSALLLISVYPFVYLSKVLSGQPLSGFIPSLPSVFSGRRSLVGPPEEELSERLQNGQGMAAVNLGKPGLTGLIQLQGDRRLSREEQEQYHLYYARNQSVLLDLEILLKTFLRRRVVREASGERGKKRQKRSRLIVPGRKEASHV